MKTLREINYGRYLNCKDKNIKIQKRNSHSSAKRAKNINCRSSFNTYDSLESIYIALKCYNSNHFQLLKDIGTKVNGLKYKKHK